jgi:predicted ATPase
MTARGKPMQMEAGMVKSTVKKIGQDLENMSRRNIGPALALDLLERRARSVEELVVIEVIREVIREVRDDGRYADHAVSRVRSA